MASVFHAAHFINSSSTVEQPYAIITVDCSDPREIDDGIFVDKLDADSETYKVGVCVADTSRLYDNGDIRKTALANGSAKYWDLPNGERGYDPMIDPLAIRDLEFTKETVRDALVMTFIVGRNLPPTDLQVQYGKVKVLDNMTYRRFSERAARDVELRKFIAASSLIRSGLGYNPGGDHTKAIAAASTVPIRSLSQNKWVNGARMNESYMIAASHLVGKLMREESLPAIYRLFDPGSTAYNDFLLSNVARYSLVPGPHKGLRLDPFCRVTSPLRRLEDFMMAHQLRNRHSGKSPTGADIRQLESSVRRLNQEIALQALNSSGVLNGRSRAGIRPHQLELNTGMIA